ncbi:TRAP transporter small permease subunit [Halopseudomonas pelagia]|uniref:TRAP transporter small permease subunit n=1 Tax=Halopseudomonas pelagia TaxID=553151 RepID=UPI0003A43574|nr:TRAP transporter small permease subunit [Halopseudomonas pelagia]|tara:strand:- start:247 stop:822 length:576 start_codon:yes stop_codon:yes gene_type:complete
MPARFASSCLIIARLIDTLNSLIGRVLSWLTLAMVLLTVFVVAMRYGFDQGATATQELVMYCHALVFMGAAAWALQRDAHVRVDIFFRSMPPRRQALVDLTGSLIFLLPMCLFLAWNCWDYVAVSWARNERSADAGGLPWVYWQKSIILLLVGSLLLQALSQIIKTACVIAGVLPTHLPSIPVTEQAGEHL